MTKVSLALGMKMMLAMNRVKWVITWKLLISVMDSIPKRWTADTHIAVHCQMRQRSNAGVCSTCSVGLIISTKFDLGEFNTSR